jgi:cell division protein FtsL
MLLRYLLTVIGLAAVGAGMLGLRQQQLAHQHAIAVTHGQMRDQREAIKDYQIRIEEMKQPAHLRDAVRRLDLRLEPVSGPDAATVTVAGAN